MWAPKVKGRVIRTKTEWLLYRPDLERKHRDYVETRMEEEEWAKMEKVDDVVMFRQHQLARMRRRRARNRLNATRGFSDTNPAYIQQHAHDVLRRGHGNRVKDWTFYRRTGAVWTDLAHTPAERVHLVVTPHVLQKDEQAARHIHKRLQEEQAIKAAVEDVQQQKAEDIRMLFRTRRAQRNAYLSATISKPVIPAMRSEQPRAKGWVPSTHIRKPVSARTQRLARPHKPRLPNDDFFTPDFKGLLVADDTTRIMAVSAAAMRTPIKTSSQRRQRKLGSVGSISARSASADQPNRRMASTAAGPRRGGRIGRPESAPPRRAQTCPPAAFNSRASRRKGGNDDVGAGGGIAAAGSPRSSTAHGRVAAPPGGDVGPTHAGPQPSRLSFEASMNDAVPVHSTTLRSTVRGGDRPTPPTARGTATARQRRRASVRSTASRGSSGDAHTASQQQLVESARKDLKTFDRRIANEQMFQHKGPHKFSRQHKQEMESPRAATSLN